MARGCPHCSQVSGEPGSHPVEPGVRCPVTGKLIDSFSPGEILEGKFEILRELARGGMGVVYVARHLALGRQVAVKVLLGELASDRELAARFEQEARAASAIGHPNIIHVYDLGRTAGGLLYMVMELLEGQSLAQLLADAGKLPISRAVRLIDQVLSALAAAHKNGIVHRDLKPDNIFVVQTEYQPDFVKLLDFGISKILAANAPGHLGKGRKETRMGTVMGTPEYMAPEQACGNVDQVDARTDLYATGIVLYELLSSQTPFTGDNYNAVMAAIIDGEHKRVRELRPSVTERLEQVIEQAIAAPREARFASAAAMRDALVAAQSDDPTRATGVAPVLELDDVDNEEPSGVYALGGAGTSDARPEPALELMPEVAPLPPPGAPTPVRPMAAQVAPRSAGSFMPASIGAAAAALAPPGAASGPRRDPFAAPDDAPESVLLLDSEVRRAHGTPRPQQLGTPVPAARVRATPLPGPAMRAPTASSSGLGRVLVWVVLVGALGTGGFLAFRRYKDRLPFGGTSISVPVAVTPAGAELRVDGQAVSGATVSLRQGKHELSAAAPGHVTRRFGFVAATGARVDVHLARGLAPVNAHDALLAGMLMPTPIAPAASSSSRIAFQASPTREWTSRATTVTATTSRARIRK